MITLKSTISVTCSTENFAVFQIARQKRSLRHVDGSKWLLQSNSVARFSVPVNGRSEGYSAAPPVKA